MYLETIFWLFWQRNEKTDDLRLQALQLTLLTGEADRVRGTSSLLFIYKVHIFRARRLGREKGTVRIE